MGSFIKMSAAVALGTITQTRPAAADKTSKPMAQLSDYQDLDAGTITSYNAVEQTCTTLQPRFVATAEHSQEQEILLAVESRPTIHDKKYAAKIG